MKTFHEVYNKSFPLKKATVKERRMTDWILGLPSVLLSHLSINFNFTKTLLKIQVKKIGHWYKTYRNKLNHLVRKAKKNFYNKKFNEVI